MFQPIRRNFKTKNEIIMFKSMTLLCFISSVIVSQIDSGQSLIIWLREILNDTGYFATQLSFSIAVVAASRMILNLGLNEIANWLKQVLTILVSFVLALVGLAVNVGIFVDMSFVGGILFAIGVALEANGGFMFAKNLKREVYPNSKLCELIEKIKNKFNNKGE